MNGRPRRFVLVERNGMLATVRPLAGEYTDIGAAADAARSRASGSRAFYSVTVHPIGRLSLADAVYTARGAA